MWELENGLLVTSDKNTSLPHWTHFTHIAEVGDTIVGGGSKYGSTAKVAAADEEGRRMATWRLLATTASQN